eukprot:891842-Rhodomonas_salina.1
MRELTIYESAGMVARRLTRPGAMALFEQVMVQLERRISQTGMSRHMAGLQPCENGRSLNPRP